jgi:drug/metabolite transporter (DMT)-like permease
MDDVWILAALLSALAGGAGYLFARRTGRNPALWAALGILLNVVGMVAICFAAASRRRAPSRF